LAGLVISKLALELGSGIGRMDFAGEWVLRRKSSAEGFGCFFVIACEKEWRQHSGGHKDRYRFAKD